MHWHSCGKCKNACCSKYANSNTNTKDESKKTGRKKKGGGGERLNINDQETHGEFFIIYFFQIYFCSTHVVRIVDFVTGALSNTFELFGITLWDCWVVQLNHCRRLLLDVASASLGQRVLKAKWEKEEKWAREQTRNRSNETAWKKIESVAEKSGRGERKNFFSRLTSSSSSLSSS